MAAGEKKVSAMTFLADVPDDAKIYVVKPGETTPYYTTKAALLADIAAGTTPNLQTRLLSVGAISVVSNTVSVASASALILGVEVINTEGISFMVPFAGTGKIRIDLIVLNSDGDLLRIAGTETDSGNIAVAPINLVPSTSVIVTQINVTDADLVTIIPTYLSFDEEQAIHNSANPNSSNPFATVNDITTPDLQAVMDAGNTITDGTYTMYFNSNNIEIQGAVKQLQILLDQLAFIDGTNYSLYSLGFINNNGVSYPLPTGVSSQIATQLYVDNKVAGLLDLRGNYDASTNAFPSSGGSGTAGAILKGDFWYISVAGTLNGHAVNVGDSIYALNDSPTSEQWEILQANLSYVPENSANKTDTMSGNTASSVKFLSAKGVYDWVIGLGYATVSAVTSALALKADKATTRQIVRSKNNGIFGSHTGNTAETVLFTIPINGGEFEISDWMDFIFQFERLVTGTNITVRFRAGTNGNTSDPQIAILTMVSTTLDSAIKRERFEFNTGNILKGMNSSSSATTTDIANIAAARTSTSLNPANNWILTVSATLGNSGDTIICTGYLIGKTKTF